MNYYSLQQRNKKKQAYRYAHKKKKKTGLMHLRDTFYPARHYIIKIETFFNSRIDYESGPSACKKLTDSERFRPRTAKAEQDDTLR